MDLASNSSTLATVDPGQIADVASDILSDPMRSLCCLVPDRNTPVICEEFRNKAEVFSWVLNAQSIMHLPEACHYVPLADLVEQAYCHDTFQSLWLVEGLGHYYADASWERSERPEGLLADPETRGVPERALMMLHAGLGLSYGDRLLKTLDRGWTIAQVRKVIGQFICLCQANSRPGYTGAAFESLGLIAQAFHPALVEIVNRVIMESYPEIFEYYWHGIGRGHYFSFRYFLPFCASICGALHHAQNMSPYMAAQQNAVAGFAWGVAMVNLESPLVIATLLAELRESGFAEALWLAEGLGYFLPGLGCEGQFLKGSRLPSWSMIPLHAGYGLRLAESCLQRISAGRGDAPAVRRELELFFIEIHHQARPGFREILYEALGLCARNLFPELIFELDRQMSSSSLLVRDFFWHGIGRGAYFSPSNLPPWRSGPWRIFETIADEAPDQPLLTIFSREPHGRSAWSTFERLRSWNRC